MSKSEIIIQLISAMAGSTGFAILYGLKWKYMPCAALGGFLSWGFYLAGMHFWNNIFLAGLSAAAFSALYSEISARILKAPATLFFIPSVIPLVPGRTLYYACSNAVIKNWSDAKYYADITLEFAMSIAAGTCIIWAITIMFENVKKEINQKKQR